uniref:uncharacterized protein LOC122582483 n=1 Tax=Erigeron canadensis TaxID=72917 RepID=UPI001CB8CB77|nr:uncharacterized protein LOC122582483 [Erigeron canadensis]XP_043610814.1 uncharacterized protein LOC122582483 [Erigeron canadensis]
MSYLQVTSVRPSLRVPIQYNTLRGSAIHCIAPVNINNLHRALKSTLGSSKKCTELMKSFVIQRTSSYQRCTPVCSFGGKGESKNSNEGSPWKSIEKAMSSFKKEQSLEDVLRQQMEKQEYYDGGSGGDSSGGGGGGGGFGGTEDEGFAGMFDEVLQVILAIIALIVLYLNIIAGDQVMLFITDTFDFLIGKKGPRLRTIMYEFAEFYQKFRAKVPYDPYWLEKEIILTPTWWDSPTKYRRMLKAATRAEKSSKRKIDSDSDSDDKSYTDNMHSDNAYGEDSDDDNAYAKKTYNDEDDDDDDDNAYNQDVDDDY